MINWTKLGLIVKPKDYNLSWWKTFGMDPCSIHLKKSIYRIFVEEILKIFRRLVMLIMIWTN